VSDWLSTDPVRIVASDHPGDVIDKVNAALKPRGLMFQMQFQRGSVVEFLLTKLPDDAAKTH